MRLREVACTSCKAALPAENLDGEFHLCPRCDTWVKAWVFPALTRERASTVTEPALIEGQSTCFYHPQKTAVIACETCGRFLCALCDVEIGSVHRCPRCLESGRRNQQLHTLQNEHTRYDRIALALTTITFLFWPLTLISAPIALYLVIRYWNHRSPILGSSRVVFIIAGLLALAEICGWAFLFYLMFHGWRR